MKDLIKKIEGIIKECPVCKESGVADIEHANDCSGWESGSCDCGGQAVQCDCVGVKANAIAESIVVDEDKVGDIVENFCSGNEERPGESYEKWSERFVEALSKGDLIKGGGMMKKVKIIDNSIKVKCYRSDDGSLYKRERFILVAENKDQKIAFDVDSAGK